MAIFFELHYSPLKEPKLQKRANKYSIKRGAKMGRKSYDTDSRYTLDSILQGFSRKFFDFDHQFDFFLF